MRLRLSRRRRDPRPRGEDRRSSAARPPRDWADLVALHTHPADLTLTAEGLAFQRGLASLSRPALSLERIARGITTPRTVRSISMFSGRVAGAYAAPGEQFEVAEAESIDEHSSGDEGAGPLDGGVRTPTLAWQSRDGAPHGGDAPPRTDSTGRHTTLSAPAVRRVVPVVAAIPAPGRLTSSRLRSLTPVRPDAAVRTARAPHSQTARADPRAPARGSVDATPAQNPPVHLPVRRHVVEVDARRAPAHHAARPEDPAPPLPHAPHTVTARPPHRESLPVKPAGDGPPPAATRPPSAVDGGAPARPPAATEPSPRRAPADMMRPDGGSNGMPSLEPSLAALQPPAGSSPPGPAPSSSRGPESADEVVPPPSTDSRAAAWPPRLPADSDATGARGRAVDASEPHRAAPGGGTDPRSRMVRLGAPLRQLPRTARPVFADTQAPAPSPPPRDPQAGDGAGAGRMADVPADVRMAQVRAPRVRASEVRAREVRDTEAEATVPSAPEVRAREVDSRALRARDVRATYVPAADARATYVAATDVSGPPVRASDTRGARTHAQVLDAAAPPLSAVNREPAHGAAAPAPRGMRPSVLNRAGAHVMPALRRVVPQQRADGAQSAADSPSHAVVAPPGDATNAAVVRHESLRPAPSQALSATPPPPQRTFDATPPVAVRPVETAPDAVSRAVGRLLGEQLADVPVWRDDDAGAAAAHMGARAFTAGGEVHMPPQEEPLSERRSTALLAHELTHVAQQRRTSLSAPDEASPRGRRLEAEARAVERRVLRHGTTMATAQPLRASEVSARPGPRHPVPASAAPTGVQRAGSDDVPAAAAIERPEGGSRADTLDLDDLARRLYGRLRRQLRDELLLDRERVGLGAGRW